MGQKQKMYRETREKEERTEKVNDYNNGQYISLNQKSLNTPGTRVGPGFHDRKRAEKNFLVVMPKYVGGEFSFGSIPEVGEHQKT